MPLSTKQMEYLALAWACMESEPKIDYEKFRELAGLKTANSARELMRVTKIKLKSEYGSKVASDSTPTKSTATPKKNTSEKKTTARKRSTPAATKDLQPDDDGCFELTEDGASPTPAKKARTASTEQDLKPVVKKESTCTSDYSTQGYF